MDVETGCEVLVTKSVLKPSCGGSHKREGFHHLSHYTRQVLPPISAPQVSGRTACRNAKGSGDTGNAEAIGGGKAVIGSNVKVAAAGASLDVPLGHKDDSWSFPHFDTLTVSVADAPRPDEILVVMAIADGGRLRNRCGTEPIR